MSSWNWWYTSAWWNGNAAESYTCPRPRALSPRAPLARRLADTRRRARLRANSCGRHQHSLGAKGVGVGPLALDQRHPRAPSGRLEGGKQGAAEASREAQDRPVLPPHILRVMPHPAAEALEKGAGKLSHARRRQLDLHRLRVPKPPCAGTPRQPHEQDASARPAHSSHGELEGGQAEAGAPVQG